MSAHFRTCRVTHLTCISPKVEWIFGEQAFGSLGWDPGHHKRSRNGPENNIHIQKVIFRVLEKFQTFWYYTRKLLEGYGVGPTCWVGTYGPMVAHASRTSGPCGQP
jgi:hypothetical protein